MQSCPACACAFHGRRQDGTGGARRALLAREWCHVDAPVAVWLVPSDAIRQQTLKSPQTPGHPYRVARDRAYGEQLACTLDDVAQIPAGLGRTAVVVVATMQSFRIEDAGQRTVYNRTGRFEPHFKGALAQDGGRALACLHPARCAGDSGGPTRRRTTPACCKALSASRAGALANWLALQRPVLVVDEAHNTKTDKSFTALQRLNPRSFWN